MKKPDLHNPYGYKESKRLPFLRSRNRRISPTTKTRNRPKKKSKRSLRNLQKRNAKQKRKLHPNPPALLFGRTIRLCKTNIPAIFLPTVSAIFTKFSGITQNCSQSLSTLRLRAETALGGRYNLYRRGRRCA